MDIKLQPLIDFGKMPIANAFLTEDQFKDEFFYDMVLGYDANTKAIGLINKVPPEKMFHENYAFFSSTSQGMALHFAETAQKLAPYAKEGIVVEVGSNDGIMLKAWKRLGVAAVGVEPSKNVAEVSRSKGHHVINSFMNDKVVEDILSKGKVSLVFGANVSCHIEDFLSYVKNVTKLIGKEGVWVFEDPYFMDIYEKTSYDQVYDEHVWYFTISFINNVLEPLGYHVFDCEHIDVHGGELRMYVGHKDNFPKKPEVDKWLNKEKDLDRKMEELNSNIKKSKVELVNILNKVKKENKKICGFGATSKGVIICNYCDIGPDLIPFITDNTPIKQGKFYPGVHIPIVPQEEFKNVDYSFLFAWNHLPEIDKYQAWFRQGGGKWITHVPQPRIIE
ncbi:MAG: SAM-dependent methyltransferase [Parcubacteria group bacterium]|nr:SAM-dependent methyltransferase [Parcubacteria group bacterium]|tara:strand:+ start:7704 stop:8876 length:1173 start_codon:yes stop_codon:yes gene_type:complete